MLDLPFRTLVNMGKTDPACLPHGRYVLINPPEAVANAADKRLTKQKFQEHNIVTAEWWPDFNIPERKFPVVVKHRLGSRGTGVYLMRTPDDLARFFESRGEDHVKEMFIVERFKNYRYEYRLHATQTGVFLANRKARVEGVPTDQRWKHSFDTSVWFNEDNPEFRKPDTWDEIKDTACKAVASLGMDFGAVDVKVNTSGKFFIIEVNSAPSLGDSTRSCYLAMIPELAKHIKQTRGFITK
jgi:glutathione synthase/RimK-type ligase-like ATP-grasp enzyme